MSLPYAHELGATAPVPTLSVVVCCFTSARRAQIFEAISSVLDQAAPADQVIVVVDHNEFLHADLRAAMDTRVDVTANAGPAGLSGARNTGLSLAHNDVVVFLDDDATLQPGALAAVRGALADESVVAIGGAVEACWQRGEAPRWFPAEFGWVIGCDYRGLPGDGAAIRNPIGAAMAVRRGALTQIEGFSSRLGRVGHLPSGCEETLMGVQLARAFPAQRIVRHTDFKVTHHVTTERATPRYFMRRCYQEGRSKAALTRMSGQRAALSSERSYTTKVLTSGLWRARHEPVRALALITGFVLTSTGFVYGLIQSSSASASRKDHQR